MDGTALAAEMYERNIPIDAVLGAATIMLNNLPDDQAQATIFTWMASLQGADTSQVEDTRVPL